MAVSPSVAVRGSGPAGRVRPIAGCETGPTRHSGPPPPGTASGRVAFLSVRSPCSRKKCKNRGSCDDASPASCGPRSRQPQQQLAFPEAGFNGPGAPDRCAGWAGWMRRRAWQRHTRTWSTSGGRRPPAAGRSRHIWGRGCLSVPDAASKRPRSWLCRQCPRLEGGRGSGHQPRPGAGHDGRRSLRPVPRVDRYLCHVVQAQGCHATPSRKSTDRSPRRRSPSAQAASLRPPARSAVPGPVAAGCGRSRPPRAHHRSA